MEARKTLHIVIPGGSGQIGRVLARHFHEQGHMVTVLSRHLSSSPWKTVSWNERDLGLWIKEIAGSDVDFQKWVGGLLRDISE